MKQLYLNTIPAKPEALDAILRSSGMDPIPARHPATVKNVLETAFGDLAPRNFLWAPTHGIIAYYPAPPQQLIERASANLDRARLEEWGMRDITGAAMPEPWTTRRPYEFIVRVLPTRRARDPFTGQTTEVEIVPRDAVPQERDAAYEEWLFHRIDPQQCANLEFAWMVGYTPGPITDNRKGRPEPTAAAYLRGEITVTDAEKFNTMLLQGIGRHRNRGYGTMLLGRHVSVLT